MPKIVAKREDWIRLGHSLFSKNGDKGIVIEQMSKKLKCNKSSFYWHFKTKKDFIDAMVEHWISKDTNDIIALVNKEKLPKDKFLKLIEISFKKDPQLDFIFYLKKYAQSKPPLKEMIDKIDQNRINYVMQLLMGMGSSKENSFKQTHLFYKYLIGYHEMIRYKKQSKNYLTEVLEEINLFIKIQQR